MTAEVVVMNRIAVAMAADTLISVRSVSAVSASGAIKSYNGARKLVALHDGSAIGAMYFDSPDFHGMPWPVVFGEFARTGNPGCEKVSLYAAEFMKFLDSQSLMWTKQEDMDGLVLDVLIRPILEVSNGWAQQAKVEVGDKDAAANAYVNAWIQARRSNLPPGTVNATLTHDQLLPSEPAVRQLLDAKGGGVWVRLSDATKDALVEAMLDELNRIGDSEPDRTGLLFAGFGERQLFPSAHKYTVSGRLVGGIRVSEETSWDIGDGRPAVVLPVAQDYMVQAFMTGIHPEMRKRVQMTLESVVALVPNTDHAALISKLTDILNAEAYQLSQPVLEGLAFLSAYDVANLARTLVALTATRNRVALQPDTVGGPFDVALISRAEGFSWHERAIKGIRKASRAL